MIGNPLVAQHGRAAGFTFIELIITLAILALLATVAVPMAQLAFKRQREQELRLVLREMRTAIDAYKRASDEGRVRKQPEDTGYPPSLQVLVQGVVDQTDPRGRRIFFLRQIVADPMFVGAYADPAQTWALRSYQSPADEPKPGDDVYDVSSKSQEVGISGLAYKRW
jgi:general secretion pathway protein G